MEKTKQQTTTGMKRNSTLLFILMILIAQSCQTKKTGRIESNVGCVDTINTFENLLGKWQYVGCQTRIFNRFKHSEYIYDIGRSKRSESPTIIEFLKDSSLKINDKEIGKWRVIPAECLNKVYFDVQDKKNVKTLPMFNTELLIGYDKMDLSRRKLIHVFRQEEGKSRLKLYYGLVKIPDSSDI